MSCFTEYLQNLLNFLEEYPFTSKPIILPVSNLVVCIFTDLNDDRKKYFQSEGQRFMRKWEEVHRDSLSVVIYTPTIRERTLHEQYMHAKKMMEFVFFKGYQQLIWSDQEVDWTHIDPFLTPTEQRTWVEMLEQLDKDRIKQWMYEQFLQMQEPYPQPDLLRIRLTSILAQVRRYMKTYALHEEANYENRYRFVFQTILDSAILYRIVQDLLLFIYEVIDGAKSQKELAVTDVIEQAIQYMETNYHKPDLLLEEVALMVRRSPAYFSHLFVLKKGIPFRQVLNTIRIRHAKKLLMESRYTIQEIADKVGFTNANYFSRIFKEKEGITPRMYRNRKKL